MRSFDKIRLRLKSLWRREQVEHEMSAELRFHVENLTRENIERGMTAAEARQAALRTMGGVAQYEEEIRDTRGVTLLETLVSDMRYALRALRKAPVFTVVAVLSLALGTGANTAIFSLIDSVMLQRLPVRDPERLVLARTSFVKIGGYQISRTLSKATLAQLAQATQIDGLATFRDVDRLNVEEDGNSEVQSGQFVSGNYFQVLGVEAAGGRTLGPGDDQAGSHAWPAMISYGYWQRRFGGSADAMGKRITVNTIPFTIVGVIPRRFRGLNIDASSDVTMPLGVMPQVDDARASGKTLQPEDWVGTAFARLKPGVTMQSAEAEMTVLLHHAIAEEKGSLTANDQKLTMMLTSAASGQSGVRNRFSKALQVLMAVVAIVMLIATANLASLLLTRSAARQREICIRMSLGSSRRRLARQLLTEAFVLSALGSGLGVVFAVGARNAILKVAAAKAMESGSLAMEWNWHLFGFTVLLCLLNAVLFGLVPAWKATRLNANLVLHSGRTMRNTATTRLGKVLVGAQVALCLMLLVGAALLLRTLANFYKVDLGYNHTNVLMMTVDPHLAGYADGAQSIEIYREMRDRLAALPGVQAVSMMREPLLGGNTGLSRVYVPGYVPTDQERQSNLWVVNKGVGPHFFSTVQMPLIAGRDFEDESRDPYGKVTIINQTMAKHYFPGKNPIGQKFSFSTQDPLMEVIGVAADARYNSLREDPQDVFFVPLLHPEMKQKAATLLIRTASDPAMVAPEARAAIRDLNRNLPIYDVTTMAEMVSENLAQQRILAILSGFFGALALVLSAIGLYGVLAYNVAQRTGEIGIRMALGATRGKIMGMVFGETAVVVGAGIVAGLAAAAACARLLVSVLYGVHATDVQSIAFAVGTLSAVAVAAAFVPMRRAVRVDPLVALREE